MERLDAFMARANATYYATHDPFADFTTAPEISQVFGELLGLWAAVTWQLMGAPEPVLLAEAGPGRGTLMADALRAIERVARRRSRAALRAASDRNLAAAARDQAARVARRTPGTRSSRTLPQGPMMLLANEFLDALPIRQFVRREAGGRSASCRTAPLSKRACPAPPRDARDRRHRGTERSLPRRSHAALGARLARGGGAALILDYGPNRAAGRQPAGAARRPPRRSRSPIPAPPT